jgi:hypothetical protein
LYLLQILLLLLLVMFEERGRNASALGSRGTGLKI